LGNRIIEMLHQIVSNIISFHTECDDFDGQLKKAVQLLSDELIVFYYKAINTHSVEQYLSIVKDVVINLNSINKISDYRLIETDEREQIYSLIEQVSSHLGYLFDYDITEENREW